MSMHHDSDAYTLVWQENEEQKDVPDTRKGCLFFCPLSFCQSSSRDSSNDVGTGRNLRFLALAAVWAAMGAGPQAKPCLELRVRGIAGTIGGANRGY